MTEFQSGVLFGFMVGIAAAFLVAMLRRLGNHE